MKKLFGLSHITGFSYVDLTAVVGASMDTYSEEGSTLYKISLKCNQGGMEFFMDSEESMTRQFNGLLSNWGSDKPEDLEEEYEMVVVDENGKESELLGPGGNFFVKRKKVQ